MLRRSVRALPSQGGFSPCIPTSPPAPISSSCCRFATRRASRSTCPPRLRSVASAIASNSRISVPRRSSSSPLRRSSAARSPTCATRLTISPTTRRSGRAKRTVSRSSRRPRGRGPSGREPVVADGRGLRSLSRQAAVTQRDLPAGGLRARALPERGAPGRGLADEPAAEINVPGMPSDAASAVRKASISDRSPDRRVQGSEGQTAPAPVHAPRRGGPSPHPERTRPPAHRRRTEPLASIFQSVSTYPHIAREVIPGNPDRRPTASWPRRAAAFSTSSTPTSSGSCALATRSVCHRAARATISQRSRAPRPSGRSTRRSSTSRRPCPASSTRPTAR